MRFGRWIILLIGCCLISVEGVNAQNEYDERVIVGEDTVSSFIRDKSFGRYDRGLLNNLFMPKGVWSFGLTASYGDIDVSDIELLSIISNLDFQGSYFSIRPDISYTIEGNQTLGMRLSYATTDVDLSGLDIYLMDDISFNLSDVRYKSDIYSASIFYRHYIGLDSGHRFALFNELELAFNSSNTEFSRFYDGELRVTDSNSFGSSLVYSPGLCLFIQEYVSFNVSFGIFEAYFNKTNQVTNNVDEGSRVSNGASFQLNLFNIRFGIAVHI